MWGEGNDTVKIAAWFITSGNVMNNSKDVFIWDRRRRFGANVIYTIYYFL